MTLHKEIHFETEICEHLAAHGWLYAEGDAQDYDRAQALFPADVVDWVQATQPKAWDAMDKNHGAQAADVLLGRLRDSINQRGTLDVLRHGVEMIGLRQPLALAQFKPALAMNPDILNRYAANRLRVVRQLRYSLHNENALDLVFFVNGIPAATVELKSDFTQSVDDAVDQYRYDREPRPKGQGSAEPLLSFPNGALVHFAVGQMEARMTTKLEGPSTTFLPFNRGDNGAAGNPPYSPSPQPLSRQGRVTNSPFSSQLAESQSAHISPCGTTAWMQEVEQRLEPLPRGIWGEGVQSGHRTAYLWEEVWARDSWLEILGRYLVAQKDSKKQLKKIIFPRFHQLDATRKLLAAVLEEGPGGKYLIQHSAGSGKTNSIAWSAHFLADLHNAHHEKLFDTVLVVSDRNVLDSQLQEAIFDFERTAGVVVTVKGRRQQKQRIGGGPVRR